MKNYDTYTQFQRQYFKCLQQLTGQSAKNPFTEQASRHTFSIPGADPSSQFAAHDTLAHNGTGLHLPAHEVFELPAALQELPYIERVLGRQLSRKELDKIATWTYDECERTTGQSYASDIFPKKVWYSLADTMRHRVEDVLKANPEFDQSLASIRISRPDQWSRMNRLVTKVLMKPFRYGKQQSYQLEKVYDRQVRRPILYDWIGPKLHLLKMMPPHLGNISQSQQVAVLEKAMLGWQPQHPDYIRWRQSCLNNPNACSIQTPKHRISKQA